MSDSVVLCGDYPLTELQGLLQRFGLILRQVGAAETIEGSWFGDPEAGIVGRSVLVRDDTPIHSALHEGCHIICMDSHRRARLHTDAGGDYHEENGVNYLQITLADYLPRLGRDRLMADMDCWGYTFRLGSARAWFENDADDARRWLTKHQLLTEQGQPTWRLRQC